MARKIVDIGVEGNDGTGDSVREAFRKTNDNFRELYAVFGQEGSLSFLDLGDTPDSYAGNENKLPIVSSQAPYSLQFKSLVGENGLTVEYTSDEIVLRQNSAITQLGGVGQGGEFGNHINANQWMFGNLKNLNDADSTALINQWNARFPDNSVTNLDSFAVSKGYADSRYVNSSGDFMTGALNVPPGASGTQVPRASEVVLRTGASMTGNLYLNDHPGELAGAGTPNGQEDLRAATKYYVDSTAYASKVNIYVSTDGDDAQRKTPPGKEGRAWAYSYRSVGAACLKAEQLIKASPWELGPYRQLIAINNGEDYSEVTAIQPRQGLNGSTRIKFNNNNGQNVDQGTPLNRDIVPGKLVVGRTSGARGFIVKYGLLGNEDFVDLRDITGTFQFGENLFFDSPVKTLEISIFIESGIYFEDFPIRIPQNVSLLGDEFRRTVIRPADRPSLSPWVGMWFFRDQVFDGLTIAETNWGYHYLTDPTNKASTPKNNRDLDVFLCNDATIIRQVSCQGHGGFMMVLDPEGQILTKSPYCQQSGSFAGSLNKQRFAGGQYVDGMAGSMPVVYQSVNGDGSEVTITGAFREPQTPTSFFVDGERFKIDTYTFSSDPTPYPNARELLLLNREFIIAETIAYVNSDITPTFVYDQEKCSRDLGFIINAVSWDMVFGGNVQTILVAQRYFSRESYNLYPQQKAATRAAIDFLKTKLEILIANNEPAKLKIVESIDLILEILDIGINIITVNPTSWSNVGTTITVQAPNHGLKLGWPITVSGVVNGTESANPPNGNYVINSVATNGNSFTYQVSQAPTPAPSAFIGAMLITVDSVPDFDVPEPLEVLDPITEEIINPEDFNSYNVLIGNRDFIRAEYIAAVERFFIDQSQVPVFDATLYNRDIERLYNAAIYDSVLGGNSQTITVVKSFFNALGDTLINAEVVQIVVALEHIILALNQLSINDQVTVRKQSSTPQYRIPLGQGFLPAANFSTAIKNSILAKIALARDVLSNGFNTLPVSINPSLSGVSLSLRDSKSLIDISSPNLRVDTINYINDQFLFDQFAASVDIGFMVDALAHDVVYGGNLKVTEHVLNYYTLDALKVSDAERSRTRLIANYVEGLAKLIVDNVDVPETGLIRRRQFQVRQGIRIAFATGSGPNLIEPTTSWVESTIKNAADKLITKKSQIVDTILATVKAQYPTLIFDDVKCSRDMGYIIDALKWDIIFNSNYQSVKAAAAYYRGIEEGFTDPTYPKFFENAATKAATLSALTTLKSLIQSELSTGNDTVARNRATALVDTIREILDLGLEEAPLYSYPLTPPGYNVDAPFTTFGNARTQLFNNKTFIVEETIAWVTAQITAGTTGFVGLSYNQNKCKRDLRFILEAIDYDLRFGGNLATIQAADAYFIGAVLQLGAGQQQATKKTYERFKSVCNYVAQGIILDPLLPTSNDQKKYSAVGNAQTALGSVGNIGAATFVNERVQEIIDTVNIESVDAKPRLTVLFNKIKSIIDGVYAFDGVEDYTLTTGITFDLRNRLETRDLLTLNRSFIKEEVVKYLDYKYSFKVTNASGTTDQFTISDGDIANLTPGMPVEFISANSFNVPILSAGQPIEITTGPNAGKYRVRFTIPLQPTTPDNSIQYEVIEQTNSNYSVSASVYDATRTFIDLIYTIENPEEELPDDWEWNDQVASRLRASGGIIGGITREKKYYVLAVDSVNSKFTITATQGGTQAVNLEEDSTPAGMICQLSYNRSKCSRDVGFIVSNISTDILYGGNLNTIKTALRYYSGSASVVLGEQESFTQDGIGYIYDLFEKIVVNEPVAVDYQQLYAEFFKGGSLTEGEQAALNAIKVYQEIDINLNKDLSDDQMDEIKSDLNDLVELVIDIIDNPSVAPTDRIVYPTYVLQMNADTPYDLTSLTIGDEFIIQAAGNTSMLSNDWTQLNDLGYGLVATNNGLLETVSVFTYYCWTAFYARNGGQIRSVGGSNAHGEYGLVAEGNDPFEVPDAVNLSDDMVQTAKIYKRGPFAAEMLLDQTIVYVEGFNFLPYNISELEINHGYTKGDDGVIKDIGITRYEISNINDSSSTIFSTSSVSIPLDGDGYVNGLKTVSGKYRLKLQFAPRTSAPPIGKYYFISGNSNSAFNNTSQGWLCVGSSSTTIELELTATNPGAWGTGTTNTNVRLKPATVIRLNLNTGGNNNTASSGLKKALVDGEIVTIRSNQNFKFYNVDRVNPIRPSTALTFRGDPEDGPDAPVYRVLAFVNKDPLSRDLITNDPVIINEIVLSVDTSFDYVDLVIDDLRTTLTESAASIENPTVGKTLGSQIGDKYLAVKKIGSIKDIARLQTGEMCFAWNGRVHRVVRYFTRTITGTLFGIVELSESRKSPDTGNYHDVSGYVGTGISASVKYGTGFFVSAATYNSGAGTVTFTIPNQGDATPTNGVSYTVIGNSTINTNYNSVVGIATATTNSTITLPIGSDPGTFDNTSITRIFLTTNVFNASLAQENTVTLKAGLSRGEPCDIIVNISTCRATSHDFLDIGSGGYNTTNYPNKIYGPGRQKSQKREVAERTTGRVFWASTDQDGFFRIGRFFTVDQGTGTVSFAASLALSNLDGLGFKRGRAISEFSDDPTFQDLADDAVPTEGAVDEYLNRRLGIDRNNAPVDESNRIGIGFLDRGGVLAAEGSINFGGFKILDVGDPEEAEDGANKGYVDNQELSDVRVSVTEKADNDILVWNSTTSKWENHKTSTASSQIQIDRFDENELSIFVKRETITDSQISETADIGQQKLVLNDSSVQRDSGTKISSVTTSKFSTGSVFSILGTPVVTGTSPNVLVKFNLTPNPSATPRIGIYYSVYNNGNGAYNGSYYAVDSADNDVPNAIPGYITLTYSENPGTFGSGATTIVAHETTITTDLPHGYLAGDTIEITGATVGVAPNVNGTWKVLSIVNSNAFIINLNTYDTATIGLTNAKTRKLGLATFNKNQFTADDGFVSLANSSSTSFTGNIIAGQATITGISNAGMAAISVGSVVRIANDDDTSVKNPMTTAGLGYESISLPITQTVVSIDGPDSVTLSANFGGTSTVNGAALSVISGIPLTSLQRIPRNTILGNLTGAAGSTQTPTLITAQQVVEAGDGIKNTEFNDQVLTAITNVKGLMSIVKSETDSRDNDYGVFAITQTGENSKIVMTNASGHITAKEFILDQAKVIAKSDSSVRMYTPGGSRILTATGNTATPASTTIYLGAYNDAASPAQVNPLGNVYFPSVTAYGEVTLSPVDADVMIKPQRDGAVGGTVEIYPEIVGKLDNVQVGSVSHTTGKFTTITATDVVTIDKDTNSTTTANGALVVSGGVGIAKDVNIGGSVVVKGDLVVDGNTVTVNSSTITVDDKTIELGAVVEKENLSGAITGTTLTTTITGTNTSGLVPGMTLIKVGTGVGAFGTNPKITAINSATEFTFITTSANTIGTLTFTAGGASNLTADGGGLILKGTTDKSILWINSTERWTSNQGFEAASIQNTPIGSAVGGASTGAFTTITASNNLTVDGTATVKDTAEFQKTVEFKDVVSITKDTESTTTATGALVVSGGVGIAKDLRVGDELVVAGKTSIDNTTEGSYSGQGTEVSPYTYDGALTIDGGTVIRKKLIVLGSFEAVGGLTVTGELSGNASKVVTSKNDTSAVRHITFVDSNNTTAEGETVYTATNLKFDPTSDGTGKLTTGLFVGNLQGTADDAKEIEVVSGTNEAGSKYLVFVDSNNDNAAMEKLYTRTNLTFDTSTGNLSATTFTGSLSGNASSATKVATTRETTSSANWYLTFVNSNNETADNEDLKTHADITVIPRISAENPVSKLTVGVVAATVEGTLKGDITLNDGVAVLTRGATAAASTFAGNATTATAWKNGTTIKLTGAATGQAIINGYSAANQEVELNVTLSGGGSASTINTEFITASNDTLHYMMFTNSSADAGTSVAANMRSASAITFKRSDLNYSNRPVLTVGGTASETGYVVSTAIYARYADLAENYLADKKYEPGTVIVFGGTNEVTISTEFNDRKVAGVVSTEPGYVMNDGLRGDTVVTLALQGRVPCKVVGKVKKGDLMVTSGIPGYAIVNNDPKVGTVIGKAVENKDTDGHGIIEVVVGRV